MLFENLLRLFRNRLHNGLCRIDRGHERCSFARRQAHFFKVHRSFPESEEWQKTSASNIGCKPVRLQPHRQPLPTAMCPKRLRCVRPDYKCMNSLARLLPALLINPDGPKQGWSVGLQSGKLAGFSSLVEVDDVSATKVASSARLRTGEKVFPRISPPYCGAHWEWPNQARRRLR